MSASYIDSLVRPFRGLRPRAGDAQMVAAPPYDVLTSAEARATAAANPLSFLHISKAEIDLPEGADVYADDVYAMAGTNMTALIADGVLQRDDVPCYYVYQVEKGAHVQTGIVAAASMAAYAENRILRHELTRPDKETDRVRQIEAVNAHTGPVFVTHRPNRDIAAITAEVTAVPPDCTVTNVGAADHRLWVVDDAPVIGRLTDAFNTAGILYIADGHHRSAAAARVTETRRAANPNHTGDETYNSFLVVSFPDDEVQILDYNRVIRDLNGRSKAEFLTLVEASFHVETAAAPVRPSQPQMFGMYLDGEWYALRVREPVPANSPAVERLDVTLLSGRLIETILGVTDPRIDPRIDFVGGGRGLDALAARVDGGEWAVAFSLFPTAMSDLIAVADAGEILPPKTTWFEPKLADGLVSLILD